MVIKQAHSLQSLVSLPAQASKAVAKPEGASSFSALFGSYTPTAKADPSSRPVGTVHGSVGTVTPPAASTPSTPPSAPFTATFVQGATVTGPDGSQTALNPTELATAPTAQEVAALLGGTVTQDNVSGGYTTSASTLEISVPGSSAQINAGLAANLFANYGTQAGSEAWQIINRDLGRG